MLKNLITVATSQRIKSRGCSRLRVRALASEATGVLGALELLFPCSSSPARKAWCSKRYIQPSSPEDCA